MCLPFPPYQLGSLFAKTNTLQILTLLIFVCPHDVAIIGACFNSCILPNATGMAGLEPTTYGFGDRCATNCATSLGELCRLHLPARILCKTTQEADGKTAKSK